MLPEGIVHALKAFDSRAEQFAIKHKDTGYHMLVGAGNLWEIPIPTRCVF